MLNFTVLSFRVLIAGGRWGAFIGSSGGIRSLCFALIFMTSVSANAQGVNATALRKLSAELELATKKRVIVGAQLAVGTVRQPTMFLQSYGRVSPDSASKVEQDTAFCIASCSKPLTSACILSLVEKGELNLDHPISEYIEGFPVLKIMPQAPVTRAPTLRQILCHRGGFYSQKRRLTQQQAQAIRNFSLTLEQSASSILTSTLDTAPGTKYAYSGAGYMIVGLAAEKGLDTPFETLLQTQICKPLEMQQTTYFPLKLPSKSIAIGGTVRGVGKQAPHLYGPNHRLPLIGGSIYSTAENLAKFASMMLQVEQPNGTAVLGKNACQELLKQQYPGQFYGLGWSFRMENQKTTRLNHSGALYSYRSSLLVDLQKGHFVVLVYTLADPGNRSAADQIKSDLTSIQNEL